MKNLALIGVGLGLGVAMTALCADRPTSLHVAIQCLAWIFAAACLLLLLGLQLRRDLVPDYLSRYMATFF